MLVVFSQLSCAMEYSFQLTRNCNVFAHPWCHEFFMASTSYSRLPLISLGGGCLYITPYSSVTQAGVRSDAWNTLWIFQCPGRANQYTTSEMTSMIGNGPYHLGASFEVGWLSCKFVPSSHTESPSEKGWKCRWPFFCSECCTRSFCAICRAPWALNHPCSNHCCHFTSSGTFVSYDVGYKVGLWPKRRVNGDVWVLSFTQVLCTYCARGKSVAQLFCLVLP